MKFNEPWKEGNVRNNLDWDLKKKEILAQRVILIFFKKTTVADETL